MTDRPAASDEHALRRMKTQKQKDTKPEVAVRDALRVIGVRFRLTPRDLPGSPDLANHDGKWAIFVHGCYWHQHPGCRKATVPKNNREWWVAKFAANAQRDARKIRNLEELDFSVRVVWECETKDAEVLQGHLRAWFDEIGQPLP